MPLASVQMVRAINPISGADKVEMAQILGWNVMVRKNTMFAGDKVVFFEIDCLLPELPQFLFLKEKGFPYRLKTEKYFKGKITSQGLALPLCDFNLSDLDVGTDLTDYLGIKKYEKIIDARLGGDNEGAFPNYIHRTDEIRLQTVPEVLDEMFDQMTYITVKLDGTSATYFCDRETGEFKVCSRNWAKKDGDNVYWNIAKKYHLADILKDTSFAIQVK